MFFILLGSSGNQAQAQAPPPVPLQRTAPARRSRNEYVNMPLNSNQQLSTAVNPQQHQAVNSSQPSGPVNGNTDMSSLISSSSPDSSIQTGPPPHHQQQQPPPLPPHKNQEVPNYVNTSEANAMQQVWTLTPIFLALNQEGGLDRGASVLLFLDQLKQVFSQTHNQGWG